MEWYLIPSALSAIVLWVLFRRQRSTVAPPKTLSEPPTIPQVFPYIGHLLGVLRYGSRYYTKISSHVQHQVYTLPVPGNRIYVVNSPKIVAGVDRNSKNISFAPYVVQFAKRILTPSAEGLHTLSEKLDDDNAPCCRNETLKVMHASLAPGKDLDETVLAVFQSTVKLLSSDAVPNDTLELFSWTRKLVTRASTDAIYGNKENPFQDPQVEAGFWAIDKDFALLGLNIFPNVIAPKASRGRDTIFEAFHQYYASKGHESGSRLVQARYEVHQKYNVSIKDVEHFDLSVCYGLLVNTVPATAWSIYYIYSQTSLLEELRSTFHELIHSSRTSDGKTNFVVDFAEVISGCPLLGSIIQETLRVQSTNASGRVVLKDTWVDQYFLKKDSILLIPSAELHSNAEVWGSSFSQFDPRRFLDRLGDNHTRVPASAYRSFGSGASVCPGRHLATKEIMSVLITMVLMYDLTPTGNASWRMPASRPHITTSILTPVSDISLKISSRRGYENSQWRFTWKTVEPIG